jgi:hypothetical protein
MISRKSTLHGSVATSVPADVFSCRSLRPLITARLAAGAANDNNRIDQREK